MNTIFISVASFRDPECNKTIKNMFDKAKYPENLIFGICQQNNQESTSELCYLSTNKIPQNQIRTINMNHHEARGPNFARYLCSTLYQNETWYFQIDSHMRFSNEWDAKLISMFQKEENVRSNDNFIFSHYPKAIENYNENQDEYDDNNIEYVPRNCKALISDNEIPSQDGANDMPATETPYPTPFLASGMVFAKAKPFLLKVPYDPYLDDIFVGEEVLHAARLWTNGFDILTPTTNISFHYYTRQDERKFWENVRNDSDAVRRVKYLLKLSPQKPLFLTKHLDKYGLGTVRPLQDYWNYMGLDYNNRIIFKNFCKNNNIEDYITTKTPNEYDKKSKLKLIFLLLLSVVLLILIILLIIILSVKY